MRKIRNLYKKILPLFMAVMALSMTVSAENYIDTDMTGSVTMTMTYDGETVNINDGVISIYHVADIAADEIGEYSYEYTKEFKGCTADLSDPSSSALPDAFVSYIDGNGISAYAKTTPSSGTASFSSLPLGMYLVRQSEASEGYYGFLPFVVTIPTSDNGIISYDVNASPKMEVTMETIETEEETEAKTAAPVSEIPNDGSTTTTDDDDGQKGSPVQTGDYMTYGMLMIMAACILALAVAGTRIRGSRKAGN